MTYEEDRSSLPVMVEMWLSEQEELEEWWRNKMKFTWAFDIKKRALHFRLEVLGIALECGWYDGEDESGLIRIDILRWLWFPSINAFGLTFFSIHIFKFVVILAWWND